MAQDLNFEMEKEYKSFLAKKGITVDDYKVGSLEAKAILVEAFEKSKPTGKLSSYSVFFCLSWWFHAVNLFGWDFHFVSSSVFDFLIYYCYHPGNIIIIVISIDI